MSNFTPLVRKEYDFDGDHVTVVFSRLKRKHVMEFLPEIRQAAQQAGVDIEKGDDDVSAKLQENVGKDMLMKLLDFGAVLATEYIKELTGLKDSEGNDVAAVTVFDEIYFVPLANSIALDIMTESFISSKNG